MNISLTHSAALAVNAAAFAVLECSDLLNSLVSRITGGSINRNTLAENVLHRATQLGLEMSQHSAQAALGIDGEDFVLHANNVLFSNDDTAFSQSVQHLVQCALRDQASNEVIPASMLNSVPTFAAELAKEYVGKQALQQFMGVYIKEHGWDAIHAQIEAQAGVDKLGSSFKDKLILAGVRTTSSFLQRVLTRASIDNPRLTAPATPELKLAAGCLHSYLTNEANCAKALLAYTPNKALIDEEFLTKVLDLTVDYAQHQADLAYRDLAGAEEMFQGDVKHLNTDDESAGQASASDAEMTARKVDASLHEVAQAKKTYEDAKNLADLLKVAKDLLVSNPDKTNEERVSGALDALFKQIPLKLDGYAMLGYRLDEGLLSLGASMLAARLRSDNGMIPANIIGTYVAEYGWGSLEKLLLAQVDKPATNANDGVSEEQSWVSRATPLITVRLAIAHLKPYIDQGDFNKSDNPEYVAVVRGMHDSAALQAGDTTALRQIVSEYALSTAYNATTTVGAVGNIAYNTAGAVGNMAYNTAGYAASLVQAGVATVGNPLPEAGSVVEALRDHASNVSIETANYVSSAWRAFAATAMSLTSAAAPANAMPVTEIWA
ncbi:hypothetical protein [Bordetella sp. 02P26C-1]|uniref:hypothetical protein n=1 Tax=Bordetella sp. 02P26C-1 TaxID=2683195 RepID=UPI0013538239|nr:hypothetical protein [Bordetella sp. 02P26C-1]MVW78562.1 hypothetical protein [Bordetella sp. 02P26C-1]